MNGSAPATRRYCLALDLKNDPQLIAEYEGYHEEVWPEIIGSIGASGIEDMEIYRVQDRLVMIMEVSEDFSFAAKAQADATNPRVQEWEELMWRFQKPLPGSEPGEKWIPMTRIFKLGEGPR